jgi:hypothetical protein
VRGFARGRGAGHLIACQKGVTETQALRQLGFPDAIAVTAPFGVYVADPVQKIQMVFIANCRDETTTLGQLQRFCSGWSRKARIAGWRSGWRPAPDRGSHRQGTIRGQGLPPKLAAVRPAD